ncbi:MAG TPA: putative Ig domain-containing protein [Gryllotalpicola sp.]
MFRRALASLTAAVLATAVLAAGVAAPAAAADELSLSPSSGALVPATAEVSYQQDFTASGGSGPYTFAFLFTAGSAPAGLQTDPAGRISGTPMVSGSFGVTVVLTDGAGDTVSQSYTLIVSPPVITIGPAVLPSAAAGALYAQTLAVTGGAAPYSFSVTAGVLPPGWSLTGGGTLSGTAEAVENYGFTVTATDSRGFTGSQAYLLPVAVPTLSLSPPTLTDPAVGVPYSQTIAASGGTAPYTYQVAAGALPDGLTLEPTTGVLSGTPRSAGPASFAVQATDSTTGIGAPFSVTLPYSFTVQTPPPAAPSITGIAPTRGAPTGGTIVTITGEHFTGATAVSFGATPAVTFIVNSETQLTALTPPGTPGTVDVTVTTPSGTSASGAADRFSYAAPLRITTSGLADGAYHEAYSETVTASGGSGPYAFLATGLPTGLSIDRATGTITGMPELAGSYAVELTITDSAEESTTLSLTLEIAANPTLIVPQSVTAGTSFTVQLSGLIPGHVIDFVLHSDPVDLGSTTVGADGTASFTGAVPAGFSGPHTLLILDGATTIGSPAVTVITAPASPAPTPDPTPKPSRAPTLQASSPVRATADDPVATPAAAPATGQPDTLAQTGTDAVPPLALAVLALLAGLVTLVVSAFRRRGARRV